MKSVYVVCPHCYRTIYIQNDINNSKDYLNLITCPFCNQVFGVEQGPPNIIKKQDRLTDNLLNDKLPHTAGLDDELI